MSLFSLSNFPEFDNQSICLHYALVQQMSQIKFSHHTNTCEKVKIIFNLFCKHNENRNKDPIQAHVIREFKIHNGDGRRKRHLKI